MAILSRLAQAPREYRSRTTEAYFRIGGECPHFAGDACHGKIAALVCALGRRSATLHGLQIDAVSPFSTGLSRNGSRRYLRLFCGGSQDELRHVGPDMRIEFHHGVAAAEGATLP